MTELDLKILTGWACSNETPDLNRWKSNSVEIDVLGFDQWWTTEKFRSNQACLWSTAALALHRFPKGSKILLVQPAVNFCSAEGWRTRTIERMIQNLRENPLGCLTDFGKLMGLNHEQRSLWIQKAMMMDLGQLEEGLQALRTTNDLESVQDYQILCLANKNDPVCKFNAIQKWCEQHSVLLKSFESESHGPGNIDLDQEVIQFWNT
jgi:hypothetical protein